MISSATTTTTSRASSTRCHAVRDQRLLIFPCGEASPVAAVFPIPAPVGAELVQQRLCFGAALAVAPQSPLPVVARSRSVGVVPCSAGLAQASRLPRSVQ